MSNFSKSKAVLTERKKTEEEIQRYRYEQATDDVLSKLHSAQVALDHLRLFMEKDKVYPLAQKMAKQADDSLKMAVLRTDGIKEWLK